MPLLPINRIFPTNQKSSGKPHLHSTFMVVLLCVLGVAISLIVLFPHIQPTNTDSYHTRLLEKMEHARSFEDFTNMLFYYEVTSDSITTTYTLKNPYSYNIPQLEPRLSAFSYPDYLANSKNKTSHTAASQMSEYLQHFSPEKLDERNKLTYTLLTKYLNLSSSLSQYPFYEGLLGSSSGVQTNLPVTLGEYPFRNERDVETYLQLLKQIPSYFKDIISYEKQRVKLGYQTPAFITASSLESTEAIVASLEKPDNSFMDTFHERIAQMDSISEKQKNIYEKRNRAYIQKYVLPTYKSLVMHLEEVLSSTQNNTASSEETSPPVQNSTPSPEETNLNPLINPDIAYGISSLPEGKTYYALLAKHNTGSERSMEELISMTDQTLTNAISTVLSIALTNQEAYYHYCEHPLETYYQSPETMLEALSLMTRDSYPPLSNQPAYEVKTVSDSLAQHLSPAFYMLPAIDDYTNNTIYINPLYTNEENGNLFPTLAHVGFPGHLYQTVYFNESNPDNIRQVLDYLGYVEGWATYVELDSLTFLDYPVEGDSLCRLYQADTIINLALCTRIDMGVHYEGWTLNDTRAFLENQGFDSNYAENIYSYVVEAPANYLSYFIGYLEIMEIKDTYQRQQMENYSEKEFHTRLLEVGPADFETVREYVLTGNISIQY